MKDPDSTLELKATDMVSSKQERSTITPQELLAVLTAEVQAFEHCSRVRVIEVYRLDAADSEGCNWSSSVVLDPAGVKPEIYSLAYADAVKRARERYNLA